MAVSRFVNVTAEEIYALKENAKFSVTLFTFAPTPYKQLIHIKQTTRKMRLFRSVFKVAYVVNESAYLQISYAP